MKTCIKCGSTKLPEDFTFCKTTLDKLRPWCKSCVSEYNKQYKINNKKKIDEKMSVYRDRKRDHILKTLAAYYRNNKDFVTELNARWAESNPEKVREAKKKWADNNRNKIAEKAKKWRLSNMDKARITVQNYQARKKAVGGKLSKNLFALLWSEQGGKCCGCNNPLHPKSTHMDHVFPLSLGGTNTDDNIQLLCQQCNNQKANKPPLVWFKSLEPAYIR